MGSGQFDPKHGVAFAFAALLLVAYPLLAAAAFDWWSPRVIAFIWMAVALAGLAARRGIEGRSWSELALIATPGMSLLAWAAITNSELPLRLLPAFVNATLAVIFLQSLNQEQSMIEFGARIIEPRLPDFTRAYCRLSTGIWAFFFIVSSVVIVWLAVFGPEALWDRFTTRNYFIVMIVLNVIEFLARKIYFRHYDGGPLDPAFAAVFPAENTAAGRRSAAYIAEERAALDLD
jgi:uncharacterized membrane protein